MDNFLIPFIGRGHEYTQEEVNTVVDVMKSAITLTQGIHLKNFQKNFCNYFNVENAFAVSNATAALEISAQCCQFEEGDEVIIPAHTYTASAYPFLKKGANIVWADIDSKTRVISAKNIEKHITKNTKAIVVVHLYGYGADMPSIMALAAKKNILVIEDAAQALGVEIENQLAGTFGDFGIFSFHSHKNLTTLGEGGMLTVKENKFSNIIPMLRHNGHCEFDFEKEKYWKPTMSNVDMPELNGKFLFPNNYCLGEVECALGSKLLKRLDQMNQDKRYRAIYFIDQLSEFKELIFHRVNSKRHNYHLLVAQITEGKRDDFIQMMAEEQKIQCVVQYYPLYRYKLYQKAGLGFASCENTDELYDNMISFPFHHMMIESDFQYLLNSTKIVLNKLR
jgi:perosamine synthetase